MMKSKWRWILFLPISICLAILVPMEGMASYPRYISGRFHQEAGTQVPKSKGGLEDNSLWRTDERYRKALDRALANEKKNQEMLEVKLYGRSYEIAKPGSGTWSHEVETWEFTREDRERVKRFVEEKGFGRMLYSNAIGEFHRQFSTSKIQQN